MAIGCVICTEAFATADPQEKYPVCIRTCGHAFHSACLRQWLTKSKTCPICRSACNGDISVNRLHLQSVNNNDTSTSFIEPSLDSIFRDSILTAKDKEIEDLRKQLADAQQTNERIRTYFIDLKRNIGHIEIELGIKKVQENGVIDLSNTPPTPPVSAAPPTTSVAGRAPARTVRQSAVTTRPALMHRTRQISSRGRSTSSTSLLHGRATASNN